jgi:hypothetical protein
MVHLALRVGASSSATQLRTAETQIPRYRDLSAGLLKIFPQVDKTTKCVAVA